MARIQADFTEAKAVSDIRPLHVPDGEYLFTVKSATLAEVKSGPNQGKKQLLWVLASADIPGGRYPYYTRIDGEQSWKLRQFLLAAGFDTGDKKKVGFDTDKVVGREIGAVLVEDEYQGKLKSVIDTVLPASEVSGASANEVEEDELAADVDDDEAAEAIPDLDDI